MSTQKESDVKNSLADISSGRVVANMSDSMTYEIMSRLAKIALLSDRYFQFMPINGPSTPNALSGPLSGTTVSVAITDGMGTTDLVNSISTVVVTASGGTAPLLNGKASPLMLTMSAGMASFKLSDSIAGSVSLAFSSPTHPLQSPASISVTDTATVTLS